MCIKCSCCQAMLDWDYLKTSICQILIGIMLPVCEDVRER
jgi:hypothetical protein